ncbi:MAG: hypothetical protein OXL98_07655 [Acidimicrobiaceae bacterium]|nr:hypothetical protein [Acidimicrobiaceae bacterium]
MGVGRWRFERLRAVPEGSGRGREFGAASLELVLLVPALTALVLFVVWAGAGGRAGLVADLAAEEAAAAAGMACDPADAAGDAQCLDSVAREVLGARPGLGELCVGGAAPSRPGTGLASRQGDAVSVGVLCRAAGAAAPLGGLAPAVDFYGEGTHVVVLPDRSVTVAAVSSGVTEGSDAEFAVTVAPPPAGALELVVTLSEDGGFVDGGYLGGHPLAVPPFPVTEAPKIDFGDGTRLDADGAVVGADDAADSVVYRFAVPTVDDGAVEPDGWVQAAVAVAAGDGYRPGAPARVAVLDDDVPTVTVAAADHDPATPGVQTAVTEGDVGDPAVYAVFTVTADQSPAEDTTIRLSVTETGDQIAAAAEGPKTVTIAKGATAATYRVPVAADDRVEASSTVTAAITADAAYAVGAPSSAPVTVLDDDVPTVTVAAADHDPATPGVQTAVTEGDATEFTVSVPSQHAPLTDLTVNLTVTQTGQYVPAAGLGARSVTIDKGATTARFAVATVDDSTPEPPGAVTATVTAAPDYAVGVPSSASVDVLDDDVPEVTVTAGADVTEADPGDAAVFAVFTVTADHAPVIDTAVSLSVTETGDQIAAAAEGAHTATIAKGATTAVLRVAVAADDRVEDSSTVTSVIEPASGYSVGVPASASLQVLDDDLPEVTVAAGPDVYEGSPAKFTVAADQPPIADTAVTLTIAETGSELRSGQTGAHTVTIRKGTTTATHPVLTRADDNRVEAGSRITATVAAVTVASGYGVGVPGSAELSVKDNDRPAVSVSPGPAITEGQTAEFTVSVPIQHAPLADLTVQVDVTQTGRYAASGQTGARSATIAKGATTAKLAVATIDDTTPEPAGAITAAITSVTADADYTVTAPSTATVAVNDNEPAVTITADTPAVTEGDNAAFTVRADPAPSADLTVRVNITQTGQYAAASALGARSITITKNTTTAKLAVATVDDTTVEPAGTVTATIRTAAATPHTVKNPSTATITVNDNEPAVTVTADTPAVTEGDNAAFTVRADPAPSADLTVRVNITQTGQYAAASALGARSITITKNTTTAKLAVATVDDTTVEPAGTVTATIRTAAATPHTVKNPSTATITVNDNDQVVTVTADATAVTEGADAAFTVRADPAPGSDLTVNITVTQTGEYVAAANLGTRNITIAKGAATARLAVPTVDDRRDEHPGTVTATINTAAGYTRGTPDTATTTVNDNDPPLSGIIPGYRGCNSGYLLYEGTSTNFCVFSMPRYGLTADVDYTIYFAQLDWSTLPIGWTVDSERLILRNLNEAVAGTSCGSGVDIVMLDWVDGTFGKDAEFDAAVEGAGALRGTVKEGKSIHLAWDIRVCNDYVKEGWELAAIRITFESGGQTRTYKIPTLLLVRDND